MPQHASTTDLTTGVLKRYLPSLDHIVESASFATIYHGQLAAATGEFEWARANIEGTLFLCESGPQEYHVIVLNRKGVNNFIFSLVSEQGIEFMDEGVHIVLPSAEQGVLCYGIWVYSPEGMSTQGDRERIGAAILECAKKVGSIDEPPVHELPAKQPQSDVLGQLFANARLQLQGGQ